MMEERTTKKPASATEVKAVSIDDVARMQERLKGFLKGREGEDTEDSKPGVDLNFLVDGYEPPEEIEARRVAEEKKEFEAKIREQVKVEAEKKREEEVAASE